MTVLTIILIALFTTLAIVGFAMEGLVWLGVVGIVAAVTTFIVAMVRRHQNRHSPAHTS